MAAPRGKAPFDRANVVVESRVEPGTYLQVRAYVGSDEIEGKRLVAGEWTALLRSEQAISIEPMNAALAVTGEIPKDPKDEAKKGHYWYWSRTWYEHQNMRDERVEAFASLLYDGVWDYSYVARATTPGTFVVPPAKAEEMYSPETFGRSRGDRFIVE